MSAENWIELIGGVALVIYLFVALTHAGQGRGLTGRTRA
jgi:K+-transporting ATPase KdpF subunit